MKHTNTTVSASPGRLRRVGFGLFVAVAFALTWWVLRPQPNVEAGAGAPVVAAPASAVKLPPLPYADAAPVLGPDRSLLEERAARIVAMAVVEPRDRAAAWAAYRKLLDRYTKLHFGGGTPAQLKEVARILDAGIDTRVERDEMDLVDALELMADLLDVLEPDAARRGALLAQWREQKLALLTPTQPRDPEVVRREAARVAAWQALPSSERDARDLEWELKQMRERPRQR